MMLWLAVAFFAACCVGLLAEDHLLPALREWLDRRWMRRLNARRDRSQHTSERRTVEPRPDARTPVRSAGNYRTELPATSQPGDLPGSPGWPQTSVDAAVRRQAASTGLQEVRHG